MANINYLLYESAAGYAVFKVTNQADSVGLQLKEVQNSLNDLSLFSKYVKLESFKPYEYVLTLTRFQGVLLEGIKKEKKRQTKKDPIS